MVFGIAIVVHYPRLPFPLPVVCMSSMKVKGGNTLVAFISFRVHVFGGFWNNRCLLYRKVHSADPLS